METNNNKSVLVNDLLPAFPVHPGSVLGEELKARGISQKKFAESIGLQATHLSALIHGTRNFTAAVAEKIASGLEGIPAEFWIKFQERYNIQINRKRIHTSNLVSGYNPVNPTGLQPAYLAQPKTAYNGTVQAILTIPEEDTELFKTIADRFGWNYTL